MEILYVVTGIGITTLIGATARVIRRERVGNALRFAAWQQREASWSAIERPELERLNTEAGAR
jgi:hypothetical protein